MNNLPRPICPECKNPIDPDWCHCGDSIESHQGTSHNHSPVPMGCGCGYEKPIEDQPPSAPLFLTAFRLEFNDELEPRVLYRVIGSGTEVECKVIADRVVDIVYPGTRPIKSGAVVVTEAEKLKDETVEETRIVLP